MTEDEFNLITALIDKNETLKVIAVGDDDQNIYSFRKSDSKYMQYLIINYKYAFMSYMKTSEVKAIL
jgi:ATP-dependent DNA helicase RecQ